MDFSSMLKNVGKLANVKQQADAMMKQLDGRVLEGISGGGAVCVKMTAAMKCVSVSFDEDLVRRLITNSSGDLKSSGKGILEDLTRAAVDQAVTNARMEAAAVQFEAFKAAMPELNKELK
jgi:DNA-binding protein YbaB